MASLTKKTETKRKARDEKLKKKRNKNANKNRATQNSVAKKDSTKSSPKK